MIARRKLEENDFFPGRILVVDLYYCAVNRRHIVYDYMLTDKTVDSRNVNGAYQVE